MNFKVIKQNDNIVRFKFQCDTLLEEVENKLQCSKDDVMAQKQLFLILSELSLVKDIGQKPVKITYPRMIVDSWDYGDDLG